MNVSAEANQMKYVLFLQVEEILRGVSFSSQVVSKLENSMQLFFTLTSPKKAGWGSGGRKEKGLLS